MGRIAPILVLSAAWLPLVGCAAATQRQGPQKLENVVDLAECRLKVPEPYNQGYADFSLILRFAVGSEGVPKNLEVLRNLPGIDEEEILACLRSWRFHAEKPDDEVLATFAWHHNRGWTTLRISAPRSGFFREIELHGRQSG